MEARQLFTLAQMHYAETGDYQSFSDPGWMTLNSQGVCGLLKSSSRYYDEAQAICQNLISKLPTNLSGGSQNNKMIIGCDMSSENCNRQHQYSVMVKLNDTDSVVGDWLCIGSSGRTWEGNGSNGSSMRDNPGCYRNP